MTERDEMLALAEKTQGALHLLRKAIHASDPTIELDQRCHDIWLDLERLGVRLSARTDADAGYGAGFEACIAKVLELKSRWDRAANNDELRSDANRHRHYATAAKLIQQELDAIAALPAPGGITTGIEAALRDDPTSDERWSAGLDFAMIQLCTVTGVDPHDVTWDAATEEVEGDVRAVIGNILRAKLGDDWSPRTTTPQPEAVEVDLEDAVTSTIFLSLADKDVVKATDCRAVAKRLLSEVIIAPPLAPDARMRRALETVQRVIKGKLIEASIVDMNSMKSLGEVVKEALSGADDASNASAELTKFNRDLAARQEPLGHEFTAEEMTALYLPAVEPSNASAEARLPGMDWELSDDAKSRIAEIDRCIVRPGDPRLNQIIGGPRPAGADDGKESEGGRELTGQEQRCVEAALFASGTAVEELRPSDPTPAEQREAIARLRKMADSYIVDPTPVDAYDRFDVTYGDIRLLLSLSTRARGWGDDGKR